MNQQKLNDKLAAKQTLLVERTAEALKVSTLQAEQLLRTPRLQSLRVNTLLTDIDTVRSELGDDIKSTVWCPEGLMVDGGITPELKGSGLVEKRLVYIQNAASWLPVIVLDPQPEETILDVCAAPGGKTSHIAARACNQVEIIANDNSRARLAKMQANLGQLGVRKTSFTLYDATRLGNKFQGTTFDKILLDVPCSGEGMMHIDRDADFATWSMAQIHRLGRQQKRILHQAWQLLRPGGTLVYSTCTIAPEENEAVIAYHLRSHQDATVVPITIRPAGAVAAVSEWNGKHFPDEIDGVLRIAPTPHIEAFFVACLQKLDSVTDTEYKWQP